MDAHTNTKGKDMTYTKGALHFEPFDGSAVILNDNSVIVCDSDPSSLKTPCWADMQEIVKRWNAHDELLAAVEYALERTAMTKSMEVYKAAIAKAKGEKT